MIDMKRLRYFVAVASERSFTKAAERLNMAQPPLSRRIQEIEEEVGVPLIDRTARPLALTTAGRLFYEQALQVLQRIDQMEATIQQFVLAERPRFVIGLIPSGFHARLPQVIRRFRLLAPDVDLSLSELTSLEQVAALKDGRIDVGLGRIRVDDPAIHREVLREEAMIIALPPGDSLASVDGAVDLALLRERPVIIYPREQRPSYADAILSLFRDSGITLKQTIEVRELQTALIMVSAGSGVCIVPASARLLAHPDVVFRPILQPATSPIILSHRMGDASASLQILFRTFADLYAEWGFAVPRSLSDRLAATK
jgi:DNA-binding transcriptional LysR family regulator